MIGQQRRSVRRYPEFDRARVAEAALKLAQDTSACEGARITATAVCGNTRYTNALPSLRIMAQTAETVMLRMAAIASLGSCGGHADLEVLQALCQDREPRIRTAAESAVKRLQRKRSEDGGQRTEDGGQRREVSGESR